MCVWRGEGLILPIVSRSRFVTLSQCLRLAWEGVKLKKALFLWNQNPEFPSFHFPQSKSYLAFPRAGIRARGQTVLPHMPSPSSSTAGFPLWPFVGTTSPHFWGDTRVNLRKPRASQEQAKSTRREHFVWELLFYHTVYTCSGYAHSGQ